MKTKIVYALMCPTCGGAACHPYRLYWPNGVVANGCIDHFHTGHLVVPSASAAYHNRPEAKRVRAAQRKARDGYVTERLPNEAIA